MFPRQDKPSQSPAPARLAVRAAIKRKKQATSITQITNCHYQLEPCTLLSITSPLLSVHNYLLITASYLLQLLFKVIKIVIRTLHSSFDSSLLKFTNW